MTSDQPGSPLLAAATLALEGGRLLASRAMVNAARVRASDQAATEQCDIRLLLAEGQPEAAIARADLAIASAPSCWRTRCLRAEARLEIADIAGAASDAADAVILAPDESGPKAVLGICLLMLGQLADAQVCLAGAVHANPRHTRYRLALAQTLARQGDAKQALEKIAEGLACEPRNTTLRSVAMRLCIDARDFRQAVALADDTCAKGLADSSVFTLRGDAESSLGNVQGATRSYYTALQLAPENARLRHLVSAAGLVAQPARLEPDTIRTLFEEWAPRYEKDLLDTNCQAANLIEPALLDLLPRLSELDVLTGSRCRSPAPAQGRFGPVLDLGCGTGLVGTRLAKLGLGPVAGIDLSPSMLMQAAAKSCYEKLVEGDIRDDFPAGLFQLVTAADLLPYFGDPLALFSLVRPKMSSGALFVLTAEALDETAAEGFRLGRHARYAHRPSALCDTARLAGFEIESCKTAFLRRDHNDDVQGCILAARTC